MFSRKQLIKLLAPLIVEQIMAVLVGMVDVVMVAAVGEAAVSGVSLVDSISVLIIQIMGALATGGAVISAQYLGKEGGWTAGQRYPGPVHGHIPYCHYRQPASSGRHIRQGGAVRDGQCPDLFPDNGAVISIYRAV